MGPRLARGLRRTSLARLLGQRHHPFEVGRRLCKHRLAATRGRSDLLAMSLQTLQHRSLVRRKDPFSSSALPRCDGCFPAGACRAWPADADRGTAACGLAGREIGQARRRTPLCGNTRDRAVRTESIGEARVRRCRRDLRRATCGRSSPAGSRRHRRRSCTHDCCSTPAPGWTRCCADRRDRCASAGCRRQAHRRRALRSSA